MTVGVHLEFRVRGLLPCPTPLAATANNNVNQTYHYGLLSHASSMGAWGRQPDSIVLLANPANDATSALPASTTAALLIGNATVAWSDLIASLHTTTVANASSSLAAGQDGTMSTVPTPSLSKKMLEFRLVIVSQTWENHDNGNAVSVEIIAIEDSQTLPMTVELQPFSLAPQRDRNINEDDDSGASSSHAAVQSSTIGYLAEIDVQSSVSDHNQKKEANSDQQPTSAALLVHFSPIANAFRAQLPHMGSALWLAFYLVHDSRRPGEEMNGERGLVEGVYDEEDGESVRITSLQAVPISSRRSSSSEITSSSGPSWKRRFLQPGFTNYYGKRSRQHAAGKSTAAPVHPEQQPHRQKNPIREPLTEVMPIVPSPSSLATAHDASETEGIRPFATVRHWNAALQLDGLEGHVVQLTLTRTTTSSTTNQDGNKERTTTTTSTTVVLHPDMFHQHTNGSIVLCASFPAAASNGNNNAPLHTVPLHVQFLEVTPYHHPANHYRLVRSLDSFEKLTVDTLVGHRGLGKTYTSQKRSRMHKLAENSVEALRAAHARGCQCVEFDVMLTKDLVPIIFHDAILQVDARGRNREEGGKRGGGTTEYGGGSGFATSPSLPLFDAVPVALHQLTYRQLVGAAAKAYRQDNVLRNLLVKHWPSIMRLAKGSEHPTPQLCSSNSSSASPVLSAMLGASPPSFGTTPPLSLSAVVVPSTPPQPAGSSSSRKSRDAAVKHSPWTSTSNSQPKSAFTHRHPHSHPSQNHAAHLAHKKRSTAAKNTETFRMIANHIPTLREVFEQTPETLRLILEVKFPIQPVADAALYLQTDHFEVNEFVTAILDVVFEYCAPSRQPNRDVMFCSFEPDVCVALVLKQSRFHVVFLSDTEESWDLKDYRSFGVETAIQFAAAQNFAGVSICATTLLQDDVKRSIPKEADLRSWTQHIGEISGQRVPTLTSETVLQDLEAIASRCSTIDANKGTAIVNCAHRHGLKVWTWGDWNSDPHFALIQAQTMQVDAVISDNVPLWSHAAIGKTMTTSGSSSVDGRVGTGQRDWSPARWKRSEQQTVWNVRNAAHVDPSPS